MPDRPTGPLSGLLVADFSRVLAGPYATMLLADLGADVVKVEAPVGDDTRAWMPPVRDGVSTYYLAINRNKRSVVLDLKDDVDVVLAGELAGRADVMIENFRPGGLDRFGLGYDDVAAGNPGVVYASISGFGTTEQGRVLPGYDLIVQAMSGLMSLTGAPETEPFRSGISVFDVMAGMHARYRHPRRTQRAPRVGAWPARRGQPALLRAVGDGQPDQRIRRRRRRAAPDGQHPSEPLPLRADPVRRR